MRTKESKIKNTVTLLSCIPEEKIKNKTESNTIPIMLEPIMNIVLPNFDF